MASHYFASHKGGIEIVAEELFRVLAVGEQEVTGSLPYNSSAGLL